LVLGTASAVAVRRPDAEQVTVANLGPNDRLYVEGVQRNPERLHLKGGEWLVAVGHEGKLTRFGQASREQGIDVYSLVEAANLTRQDAVLRVTANMDGCRAKLDGRADALMVPANTPIEAGRELDLEVSCPGALPAHRTLLAVPGQTVLVKAGDDDS
jgi:hypothetical protein